MADMAVAVVVDDEDRVLLVRRRAAGAGGEWQFPAGVIRPGERVRDVAVWETGEQAGVHAHARVRLGEGVHPVTGAVAVYVACGDPYGRVEANRSGASHGDVSRSDVSHGAVSDVVWVAADQLDIYLPGGVAGPVREYLTSLPAVRRWQNGTAAAATAALHAYHAGWRPTAADVHAGDQVLTALARWVDLTGELPAPTPPDPSDSKPLLLDPDEIRATVTAAFTTAVRQAQSAPWRRLLEAAQQYEPQPWRPGLWRETAHAILTDDIQH